MLPLAGHANLHIHTAHAHFQTSLALPDLYQQANGSFRVATNREPSRDCPPSFGSHRIHCRRPGCNTGQSLSPATTALPLATAAAGSMLHLEALVAASREAAMAGDDTAMEQMHLHEVSAHAQRLLAAIEQRRRETRGGVMATASASPDFEDDPQLAAQQSELLLCFRIFRNAAAAGPGASAALLSAGLLELAGRALDLLASAAIPLDWQLPAALAQALANLCTASREAAAAAWSGLFPLRLSMLAHVTAGKCQATWRQGSNPMALHSRDMVAAGASWCGCLAASLLRSPPASLQAQRRPPPAWRCWRAAERCKGPRPRWRGSRAAS